MSSEQNTFTISEKNCAQIDRWLEKYPPEQKRSAVVATLMMVQEQNGGWLSDEAMLAVANYLDMAPIEVREVATFYDMYHLKQSGKTKISVCTNVSCMLRGSADVINFFEKRLNIKVGQTTEDGKYTLTECECMAACGGAPMCTINDKHYHENLTTEKLTELMNELEQESAA